MATRTQQRPASAGRFARSTTSKKKPQTSSSPLSALTGMFPGSKPTPAKSGGGKSKAGMAALAGVAGFAIKNRSKITGRFGSKTQRPQDI